MVNGESGQTEEWTVEGKGFYSHQMVKELALKRLTNLFTVMYALFRQIPFFWNAWEMIGKPAFFLLLSVGIHYFVSALHPETGQLPLFLETALQIFFFSFSYGGLLLVFHLGRLGSRR